MKKQTIALTVIALFSLPAFATDYQEEAKGAAITLTGVSAADFGYNAYKANKEASPHIERAIKYGDVADTYEAARAKLRKKLAPAQTAELEAVEKQIAESKTPAKELLSRQAQLTEEIEKAVARDYRERSFIRYGNQNVARQKKSMGEALKVIKSRGARAVVGAAGIAAGIETYKYLNEEKIEERHDAPAPAAEASAEEDKIPSHIASQLDAGQDNPF